MAARKGKAAGGASKRAARAEGLSAQITAAFVAALEDGVADPVGWRAPWHAGTLTPRNALTNVAYRGSNALWLALLGGGVWAGYGQWEKLGAQVRKGEHGTDIFVPMTITKREDEHGNPLETPRTFTVFGTAKVFSAAQVDGYVAPETARVAQEDDPAPEFDAWLEALPAMGVTLRYVSAGRAYYAPGEDAVTLPPVEDFKTLAGFRSTLAHEYGHATGHASRLNRDGITGRHAFGSEGYAREELVAELTSAIVGMALGIATELREDHRDYLANWIQVLKADPHALQDAAKDASKAAALLLAYAETGEEEAAA